MLEYNNLPRALDFHCVVAIYKIECTKNQKVYIGQTGNPRERCKSHRQLLVSGKHYIPDMQKDFIRFGEECFTFEILEQTDDFRSRFPLERFFMELYKSYDRECGYNYRDRAFNWAKASM